MTRRGGRDGECSFDWKEKYEELVTEVKAREAEVEMYKVRLDELESDRMSSGRLDEKTEVSLTEDQIGKIAEELAKKVNKDEKEELKKLRNEVKQLGKKMDWKFAGVDTALKEIKTADTSRYRIPKVILTPKESHIGQF